MKFITICILLNGMILFCHKHDEYVGPINVYFPSWSFHLPTLECPGLEKSEVSWTSLDPPEAGDEGMGARSPPGEESKRLEEGELPGAPRWLRRAVREEGRNHKYGWKKTNRLKGLKVVLLVFKNFTLSCLLLDIFLVLAYNTNSKLRWLVHTHRVDFPIYFFLRAHNLWPLSKNYQRHNFRP